MIIRGLVWTQKKIQRKGRSKGCMWIDVRKELTAEFNIINNSVKLFNKQKQREKCAIISVNLNEKNEEKVEQIIEF